MEAFLVTTEPSSRPPPTAPEPASAATDWSGDLASRDSWSSTESRGDDADSMHARYYSPHVGRFLSVDPKTRRRPTKSPQRWNRYAYALGNPINYVDPDGRDVVYQTKKDRKFFESQAARSVRARAVLGYFAPGTGRNLYVNRGNAGRTSFGVKRAGVTDLTLTPHSPGAFRQAYETAGGGAAGEAAVMEMGDRFLSEATITLTSDATDFQKLHELGHVEEGMLDPAGTIESAAEADMATTIEEYSASSGEQYADEFAEDVLDDDEDEPQPE